MTHTIDAPTNPKSALIATGPMAYLRDWGELLIVLLLYFSLVLRMLPSDGKPWNVVNLLLLPSEGLVVYFLLFRRPAELISARWQDWLLALSATVAPMLVIPRVGTPLVPTWLGAALLLMGMVLQVHAKLALGRSFGCVPAHRGLAFAGPYRFVRHPMYAGYLLSHIAYLLINPTAWNMFVYVACYALQIPRIYREEVLLSHDPRYREYQAIVKYRLIPGVI